MSNIENNLGTKVTSGFIPDVKQKNLFEQALDKLDLQGTLVLLTVLSERALFLQSKELLSKPKIEKPKIL